MTPTELAKKGWITSKEARRILNISKSTFSRYKTKRILTVVHTEKINSEFETNYFSEKEIRALQFSIPKVTDPNTNFKSFDRLQLSKKSSTPSILKEIDSLSEDVKDFQQKLNLLVSRLDSLIEKL